MHINTLINAYILKAFPEEYVPSQLFWWLYAEIHFDWFGIYPPIHAYVFNIFFVHLGCFFRGFIVVVICDFFWEF